MFPALVQAQQEHQDSLIVGQASLSKTRQCSKTMSVASKGHVFYELWKDPASQLLVVGKPYTTTYP